MKIIPLSDLRDTKYISDLVMAETYPIFVTKQGTSHIVIMKHDDYIAREDKIRELEQEIKRLKTNN